MKLLHEKLILLILIFLSAGTLLNFLGAIALGAPVTSQYVKLVVCRVNFFFFLFRTLHVEFVVVR